MSPDPMDNGAVVIACVILALGVITAIAVLYIGHRLIEALV